MPLRTKFIVFVVLIHLIVIGLSFYLFQSNIRYFILSELLILISIGLSWRLYQDLIQPINLLSSGMEALKDQDFNVKFVPTGKPETDQLINIYNQMIDQLREERTRQEQQNFFLEKLVQTSPTGILILDYDERVATLNPKALNLLKIDEEQVVHQSVCDLQHPVFQAIAHLKTGQSKIVSINGTQTFRCQKAHFIDRGFARYFVLIEELTVELLAAEKNAYGKVIRLMAHEVNNSIGAVNSILDSSLSYFDQTPDLQHALQVAIERNDHLNHFMRNFADVVRLPPPRKEHFALRELLQRVATLMEPMAQKRQVALVWQLDKGTFDVFIDIQQMEQVFINVFKNAMEAIGQNGTITLQTNANQRILQIIDTGRGIAPDVANQLFSPFFSTKTHGQGIGLTLVREILINHGFEVSLQTKRPKHTVFEVIFHTSPKPPLPNLSE
ncbi:MAG: ATP-binding protein [Spirosomaceae bacterium]|nr:ATP-binding protein [Spirosomataceae bacterium]